MLGANLGIGCAAKLHMKISLLPSPFSHCTSPKSILSLVLLAIGVTALRAEIIPADRRIDWTRGTIVGVPGGIPTNRAVGTSGPGIINVVTDWGADPTGATDSSWQIYAAMVTAGNANNGTVVYMPAGTYQLSTEILPDYRSNYTLRGAGMGLTFLVPSSGFTGQAVLHSSTSDWPAPTLTDSISAGAAKGSTTITIGSAAANYVDGGLMRIGATTTPSFCSVAPSFMHRVRSHTSTTVTFDPPLAWDMSSYAPASVYYATSGLNACQTGIGYENFTIDLSNTNAWGIFWEQSWGCWLKNVEIKQAASKSVYWFGVNSSSIFQCYFHNSIGGGSNKEGVDLAGQTCWNLVENSIVYKAGAIVLNDAAFCVNGNVIDYNFSYATSADNNLIQTTALQDIDFGHGGHQMFNLAEGNVIGKFQADGYFGSSSHNTVFRNYITNTHPEATNSLICIQLTHTNTFYNIVGNILGTSAMPSSGTNGGGYYYGGYYEAPQVDNYDDGASTGAQVIYQLGFPYLGFTGFSGTIAATNPPNYVGLHYFSDPPADSRLDLNVASTMARHGNYHFGPSAGVEWETTNTNVTDYTDHTLPKSLIFTARPPFFPVDFGWPRVNPLSESRPTDFTTSGGATPPENSQLNPATWAFYHKNANGIPVWPANSRFTVVGE